MRSAALGRAPKRELERTGIQHVESWELTPTEAQVAGLAAAGAKNKEIADQLFMSVKTVEANLSRVYGKLGIRSRTDRRQDAMSTAGAVS